VIIGTIAPVGEKVIVNMSDGNVHTGHFNSHTFPFASFKREDDGDIIYIQIEQITTLYVPAESPIVRY